ncbi:ATP-binding protein [Streptomyces sp. NPDC056600]|uniref:sensor histidine kinase n=1 Tax=Streptomyces sp. NPDC056600 TaxID=3345874 RepID=UPI0036A26652
MKSKPSGVERVFSGWTTHSWLRAGVTTTLLVLAALGSLSTWAMVRTSDLTTELTDRRSPALIASIQVEKALVNQETGLRGYGLTGNAEFLEPYTEGVADEKDALRSLRPLVKNDVQAQTDLDEIERLSSRWKQRMGDPVSSVAPEEAVKLASARASEGKRTFDLLREAMEDQQTHLQAERKATTHALRNSVTLRNWTLGICALVIVAVAGLMFEALRRGVTGPLTRLGTAARDVAEGRFDRSLDGAGPADLRQLADDLESMRRRLVQELEFTESARRRLDDQAADLKRSNAELEQFAYVASHDLQEPLRKVSSFTQLLQRRYGGQLDERADQYIGFAVDGANRMQKLINDLLAFSRVGRLHNDHRPADLDEILEDTLGNLSVAVEESGAEITRDPLPTVLGDTAQLGMLWQNLLSNAIKFRSPDRTPRINISTSRTGDTWTFAVTDNGIGIAPEFQEKVFVIFQRLHTKDAYPGTGIGLAMCKKIVEFHGGTIKIDPEYTLGTRVVFTLPAAETDPAAPDEAGQP